MLRNLMALLFIVIGAVLVLANFDIIYFDVTDVWNLLLPIILIVFGIKWFTNDIRKWGGSWMGGSFLIIFGVLLLLGYFDVINFTFSDVFKLWPLLIIYIGFSIIGKPGRGMKFSIMTDSKKDNNVESKRKGNRFSIGDHEFKKPNWKVEPMDLFNAAGNYYIDFTKAFIPEKEIPITINSWAGDVQILLPENLAFRIDASVKAGEINVLGESADGVNRNVFYESTDYENAVRKIDIRLKLKAGSILVDRV
ncbi:cell wall-active antibiotics response protein LiaF [Virgibacillus ndiopensis]|uniref:cell wall-active antibiotics response protein LiaF n=1 Tax=Virgibacillus ndiopensis TaxID=2004408 RepID=UPI000C0770D5|nr:cell wall-active antibiotics response protein LiaF [Virgibacillus ndiopensis]